MADTAYEFHFAEEHPLAPLEDDCRLLGSLLDDCLRIEVGEDLLKKVERIRSLAQCASELASKGDTEASQYLAQRMAEELMKMPLQEAFPITRACSHYLNLTSIAETVHRVRKTQQETRGRASLAATFEHLLSSGVSKTQLRQAVSNMSIEIVLTAHPTQVNRRTLQYKHTRIAHLLQQNTRVDLSAEEKDELLADLVREITALWQTDELRRKKPTPVDEARGGLHIVEQCLWDAVPAFLRRLSNLLRKHTGEDLPVNRMPLRFASWMGGDRDGNPNVTASVTRHVAYLARWMAADMYVREIDALRFELSMTNCNDQLWAMASEILAREHKEHSPHKHKTTLHAANAHHHAPADDAVMHLPEGMVVSTMNFTRSADVMGAMHPHVPHTFARDPDGSSEDGDHASMTVSPSTLGMASPRKISTTDDVIGWSSVDITSSANTPAATPAKSPLGRHNSSCFDLNSMPSTLEELQQPEAQSQMKRRGMHAHAFHKTSMDFMLNNRHRGYHPYRIVLGDVRHKLAATRSRMEELLNNNKPTDADDWFETEEQFAEPLLACYWSLWECGSGIVAEGRLLDLLRRLFCFGMSLLKMDVRQEASRHIDALDAVTSFLGMGSYREWSEEQRQEFLVRELEGKRPLIPQSMPMDESVREVIDTFRMTAELGRRSLGAYVISMASQPSDVLAVELLQREARMMVAGELNVLPDHNNSLRVVPLFETLDDLTAAETAMRRLFTIPWYREHVRTVHDDHQEVMLGYSDSGKDAGRLAASWALYICQEELVSLCEEFGIQLNLFHGRGGTIGRGGGPMFLAIQSQPPGSVQGCLRVTEQGEMVQAKFGLPAVALTQLETYTTAVLQATLAPPTPPKKPEWRAIMQRLSELSCSAYREVVVNTPKFLNYFRHATPEEELGNLNIGSRPARRKKDGGVSSLRAIPWIFAWTQTRHVLPSWLGVGTAINTLLNEGNKPMLRAMYKEWAFFQSTIDLIEMILAKVDMRIAAWYDRVLVTDEEERALGATLRGRFAETVDAVLNITGHHRLCENNSNLRNLISMRNPFIDPVNILQVEILRRLRQDPNNVALRDLLLITINGIAAGMRNTG